MLLIELAFPLVSTSFNEFIKRIASVKLHYNSKKFAKLLARMTSLSQHFRKTIQQTLLVFVEQRAKKSGNNQIRDRNELIATEII